MPIKSLFPRSGFQGNLTQTEKDDFGFTLAGSENKCMLERFIVMEACAYMQN